MTTLKFSKEVQGDLDSLAVDKAKEKALSILKAAWGKFELVDSEERVDQVRDETITQLRQLFSDNYAGETDETKNHDFYRLQGALVEIVGKRLKQIAQKESIVE